MGNAEGDEMIRETHNQKQESYLTKIKGFKLSLGGHNSYKLKIWKAEGPLVIQN